MDEYPDELRTAVPGTGPDFGPLGDFLWEAASWDPAIERLTHEEVQGGTERELAAAARRLLKQRLLAEPSRIARLVRLMAGVGLLDFEYLTERPDAAAAGRAPGPDLDPLGAGIPMLGREAERALANRGKTRWPTGVSIVCVTGPAGAGKTRLAREVMASSDHGQPRLHVSLSRAAPGTQNRPLVTRSYEALAELLAQLGVPDAEIPDTEHERRARYVQELAEECPVILLDGAVHEDQVSLLLPPRRGSVVITSRSALTGLHGRNAQFVALGRLNTDWSRRLVNRVFQAHGVEADDRAAAAIHRWSDGLPGPAVLLSRWAAVTAKAQGLAPEAVINELEAAHRDGDELAAVLGLLDDDQRAVLRVLTALRLPRADLRALSLSSGLSLERASAVLARLAGLGLAGLDERDGTWAVDPVAADCVQARAAWALTEADYEQALGPVIGLYALRARALGGLLTAVPPEAGSAVQAWAVRQWQAEQPGLAAVLEAAAAAPRPAVGHQLAAAFMDAAAAGDSGWRGSEACATAIEVIARDADDGRLDARALEWLRHQDQVQGVTRPELGEPHPDLPDVLEVPLPEEDLLPVERAMGDELIAAPPGPVLFGAGDCGS
jgi:hypothetical protein